MNRTASMILGLALVACGGPKEAATPPQADPPASVDVTPPVASTATPAPAETPPAEAAEAAPPAPPIAIAPLTLTLEEVGKAKEKMTLELAADGTVTAKGKKGGKTLRFVENKLLDDTGSWVTRVLADGSVEIKTVHVSKRNGKVEKEETKTQIIGKFGANDELAIEKGGSVRVDDKGAIVLTGVDPKLDPTQGIKMGVKGVTPASRRAATLLFVSILAPSRSESDVSDATAATPAQPPTPAQPGPKK